MSRFAAIIGCVGCAADWYVVCFLISPPSLGSYRTHLFGCFFGSICVMLMHVFYRYLSGVNMTLFTCRPRAAPQCVHHNHSMWCRSVCACEEADFIALSQCVIIRWCSIWSGTPPIFFTFPVSHSRGTESWPRAHYWITFKISLVLSSVSSQCWRWRRKGPSMAPRRDTSLYYGIT